MSNKNIDGIKKITDKNQEKYRKIVLDFIKEEEKNVRKKQKRKKEEVKKNKLLDGVFMMKKKKKKDSIVLKPDKIIEKLSEQKSPENKKDIKIQKKDENKKNEKYPKKGISDVDAVASSDRKDERLKKLSKEHIEDYKLDSELTDEIASELVLEQKEDLKAEELPELTGKVSGDMEIFNDKDVVASLKKENAVLKDEVVKIKKKYKSAKDKISRKNEKKKRARERKKRRELFKKRVQKFFKNKKRKILDISIRKVFIYFLKTVLAILILIALCYLAFAFIVIMAKPQNKTVRSISRYFYVPAVVSSVGTIGFYEYFDAVEDVSEDYASRQEASDAVVHNFIEKKIMAKFIKKYGLDYDAQAVEKLNRAMVRDKTINKIAYYKIEKIKNMISDVSKFEEAGRTYGAVDHKEESLEFLRSNENVARLDIDEVSDLLIGDIGYYFVKKEPVGFKYIFVKAITFEDYLIDLKNNLRVWILTK